MKIDVVVVGSGFGGSLTALIAHQIGLSVMMIEKESHPRFVIGESTTPLTNLYLESLCDEYDLPEVRYLSKWGSWQAKYPEISVGLKRGFSFFHHNWNKPFLDNENHENQLLVAANPHNRLGDTHWYRPDFDQLLVKIVQEHGIIYSDQTDILEADFSGNVNLVVERKGVKQNISARFLVDASGLGGFIYKRLKLSQKPIPNIPNRHSLYNHFKNVGSVLDWIEPEEQRYLPYNPDDSAIHHIFDGGWIWMLKFNNGIMSAGVSLKEEKAREYKLWEGDVAWHRLLENFPSINDLFKHAETLYPFWYLPQMSFRSDVITGQNWAMLPSAAGFVDPLMSTGFPFNLRGIMRMGEVFKYLKKGDSVQNLLDNYAFMTQKEMETSARMITALQTHFDDFNLFAVISLLYFAAASYSESVIRLGKPDLATSFLLEDDPDVGPLFRKCYDRALGVQTDGEKNELINDIYHAVRKIDVAGLSKQLKNWYPVKAVDMLENAEKLRATPEEIQNYLDRSGFYE